MSYTNSSELFQRLANSQTFMNAAHKTHKNVLKSQKAVDQFAKDAPKLADKHTKDAHGFFSDFFGHFREEIGKGGRK
jgi:hypothetical protein